MKKTLVLTACLLASAVAFAQGTVNFSNTPSAIGGAGAPIYDADGTTPLAGADFWVQLYGGPEGGSLAPVGAAVNFLTGGGAGFFRDATARSLGNVAGGANASLMVKAWEAAGGDSFEAAQAGGFKWGESDAFVLKLGNEGQPPSLPANMVGLASFKLVPEPSTIALGLLGATVLMLRRRK